jgi:hypothetical protein
MTRVLPIIVAIVAAVYCAVECAQSDRDQIRNLPKPLWLFLIVIVPILGPASWFLFGRPRATPAPAAAGPVRPRRRPVAPDDDPRFLDQLDRTNREIRDLERELGLRDDGSDDTPAR